MERAPALYSRQADPAGETRTINFCSVKEVCRYLVEHLSLVGNAFGKDYVECRDTVGGDHHQIFAVDVIDVADFAMIQRLLAVEFEISCC